MDQIVDWEQRMTDDDVAHIMAQAGLSDFASVEEVAEMLRVKPTTVRAWIRGKRLKAYRLGRAYRIPKDDVARILREWSTF